MDAQPERTDLRPSEEDQHPGYRVAFWEVGDARTHGMGVDYWQVSYARDVDEVRNWAMLDGRPFVIYVALRRGATPSMHRVLGYDPSTGGGESVGEYVSDAGAAAEIEAGLIRLGYRFETDPRSSITARRPDGG